VGDTLEVYLNLVTLSRVRFLSQWALLYDRASLEHSSDKTSRARRQWSVLRSHKSYAFIPTPRSKQYYIGSNHKG